jgi:hypothetical protein
MIYLCISMMLKPEVEVAANRNCKLGQTFLKIGKLEYSGSYWEAILYIYYSLEMELQAIVLKTIEYYDDIQPSVTKFQHGMPKRTRMQERADYI